MEELVRVWKQRQQQIPFGNDNQKYKSKGKRDGNSRFPIDSGGRALRDDTQKGKGDSGEDKNAGGLRLRALRCAQDDRVLIKRLTTIGATGSWLRRGLGRLPVLLFRRR